MSINGIFRDKSAEPAPSAGGLMSMLSGGGIAKVGERLVQHFEKTDAVLSALMDRQHKLDLRLDKIENMLTALSKSVDLLPCLPEPDQENPSDG